MVDYQFSILGKEDEESCSCSTGSCDQRYSTNDVPQLLYCSISRGEEPITRLRRVPRMARQSSPMARGRCGWRGTHARPNTSGSGSRMSRNKEYTFCLVRAFSADLSMFWFGWAKFFSAYKLEQCGIHHAYELEQCGIHPDHPAPPSLPLYKIPSHAGKPSLLSSSTAQATEESTAAHTHVISLCSSESLWYSSVLARPRPTQTMGKKNKEAH